MQPIQPSKRKNSPSTVGTLYNVGCCSRGAEAGLESRPQGRGGRELRVTHLTARTKARAQHPTRGEPAFLRSQEGLPQPPTRAQQHLIRSSSGTLRRGEAAQGSRRSWAAPGGGRLGLKGAGRHSDERPHVGDAEMTGSHKATSPPALVPPGHGAPAGAGRAPAGALVGLDLRRSQRAPRSSADGGHRAAGMHHPGPNLPLTVQELESRHVNHGEVGENVATWAVLAPLPAPVERRAKGCLTEHSPALEPPVPCPHPAATGGTTHTQPPPSKGSQPDRDSGLQSRGGMATSTVGACATLGSGSGWETRTGRHHGTTPIRALPLSVEQAPRGAEQDARVRGRKDRPGKGTSAVPCPPCRNSTSGNQAAASIS